MIKNIQIIKDIKYTLEEKDIKIIKNCLNYCYHRLKYHKSGINNIVDLDEINRLREEFGIIKKINDNDIKKEKEHNEIIEEIDKNYIPKEWEKLINYIFNK